MDLIPQIPPPFYTNLKTAIARDARLSKCYYGMIGIKHVKQFLNKGTNILKALEA